MLKRLVGSRCNDFPSYMGCKCNYPCTALTKHKQNRMLADASNNSKAKVTWQTQDGTNWINA